MKQQGRNGRRTYRGGDAQTPRGGPPPRPNGPQPGPDNRNRPPGGPVRDQNPRPGPVGPAQRPAGGQYPGGGRPGQNRFPDNGNERFRGNGGYSAPPAWNSGVRRGGGQRPTGWLHIRPWSPDQMGPPLSDRWDEED